MFLLLDLARMFIKKISTKCLLRPGVKMEFSVLLREDLFRKQTNRFSHLVQEVTSRPMLLENRLSQLERSSVVALCSCQRPSVVTLVLTRKLSKAVKQQPMTISYIQSQRTLENELSKQIIHFLLSYQPKTTLQWLSVLMLHVSHKNRLMKLKPSLAQGTMNKRVVSLKKGAVLSKEVFKGMQQLVLQWVVQAPEQYHTLTQPLCKVALRVNTSYLKLDDLDLQKRSKFQGRHQVLAITLRRIYRSGSNVAIT